MGHHNIPTFTPSALPQVHQSRNGHTHMLSLPKSRPHTNARLPGDAAALARNGSHANAAASLNTAAAFHVERCTATAAKDFAAFPRRARGVIEVAARGCTS